MSQYVAKLFLSFDVTVERRFVDMIFVDVDSSLVIIEPVQSNSMLMPIHDHINLGVERFAHLPSVFRFVS